MQVDSCENGVGAVLSQEFEDGEHPVAYYSRSFHESERMGDSSELEAIGVIKALDHFYPYIYGVDFDLQSDNMNLTLAWLKRQTKGKLGRWAQRLNVFDGYMTIRKKSGRVHGNAETLVCMPLSI